MFFSFISLQLHALIGLPLAEFKLTRGKSSGSTMLHTPIWCTSEAYSIQSKSSAGENFLVHECENLS